MTGNIAEELAALRAEVAALRARIGPDPEDMARRRPAMIRRLSDLTRDAELDQRALREARVWAERRAWEEHGMLNATPKAIGDALIDVGSFLSSAERTIRRLTRGDDAALADGEQLLASFGSWRPALKAALTVSQSAEEQAAARARERVDLAAELTALENDHGAYQWNEARRQQIRERLKTLQAVRS